jgi:uncharacterized SAM-binding protein YcdF (DUF218 family)
MKRSRTDRYRRPLIGLVILVLVFIVIYFSFGALMRQLGRWIVVDETPTAADAVVVLNTGLEYYPRLIQAADIYRAGLVKFVLINGNRKTDSLRQLESEGFQPCCPWYANSLQVLSMYGVPSDKVIAVSAEDAYDTISEAEAVSTEVLQHNWKRIIVTTSKFHTRRARHIWQKVLQPNIDVTVVAARSDPYDPERWWKSGRQIRWVLAEYGAWIFFWWNQFFMNEESI